MSTSDATLERASILLVDDRPSNLTVLQGLLRRPDYDLVLARSGPEALGEVLRSEFAVILLDIAMPGMDGFEVASMIKEREQSKLIPIIFITASVYDMEHIFQGYSVGAVDYLRKPVDPHALRSKVAVFVELHQQRRQIERQSAMLRKAEQQQQILLVTRAEDALRESEALYQLTFEEAPVAIGHADVEGRWTRGNRRLYEMLGCEHAALIGRRIQDMAYGEDKAVLAHRLALLGAGDDLYAGEHRFVTSAGAPTWVAARLSVLRDAVGGGVRQIIVVLEDVGERKQIEIDRTRLVHDLQEGIMARDDFLALAAHELRTPITPLRLQAESLARSLQQTPDEPLSVHHLTRRLKVIGMATERLEAVIDRLLDVSRLQIGRVLLKIEEVDLAVVVRAVAGRLNRESESTGSPITVYAEAPVVGRWDRLRVEQVVLNLLANAIKYGEGKPIDVGVAAAGEVARLSVRDRGLGIPADAQQRIFERFERAVPVHHFGGLGLGLWIARRAVEVHGGHVSVRSMPGEGSEFTVTLPLVPEVAELVSGITLAPQEANP